MYTLLRIEDISQLAIQFISQTIGTIRKIILSNLNSLLMIANVVIFGVYVVGIAGVYVIVEASSALRIVTSKDIFAL